MKVLYMWKQDLIEGIWRRKIYLLLPVLITICSCMGIHHQILEMRKTMNVGNPSFMDYWVYLVMCGKEYKFDVFKFFDIPMRWICLMAFVIIGLGNYITNDLQGFGCHVITRSKSRKNWWISKAMWGIAFVICYFAMCFITTAVFTFITNSSFSLKMTPAIAKIMCKRGFLACSMIRLFCISFVQPVLLAILLGMIYIVLNFIMKPTYSFIVIFSVLVISTYYKVWWLIGNWGMPYRMYPVQKSGLNPKMCLVFLILGLGLVFLVGHMLFKRKYNSKAGKYLILSKSIFSVIETAKIFC